MTLHRAIASAPCFTISTGAWSARAWRQSLYCLILTAMCHIVMTLQKMFQKSFVITWFHLVLLTSINKTEEPFILTITSENFINYLTTTWSLPAHIFNWKSKYRISSLYKPRLVYLEFEIWRLNGGWVITDLISWIFGLQNWHCGMNRKCASRYDIFGL